MTELLVVFAAGLLLGGAIGAAIMDQRKFHKRADIRPAMRREEITTRMRRVK